MPKQSKSQKRLVINDLVNAKSFETSSRLNLRKLSQKESFWTKYLGLEW
mgnify:FL=1